MPIQVQLSENISAEQRELIAQSTVLLVAMVVELPTGKRSACIHYQTLPAVDLAWMLGQVSQAVGVALQTAIHEVKTNPANARRPVEAELLEAYLGGLNGKAINLHSETTDGTDANPEG